MQEKIIRKIDELGRIVLPYEYRVALSWTAGSNIAISQDGERLIMQANESSCFLCGSRQKVRPIRGFFIGTSCIEEISDE